MPGTFTNRILNYFLLILFSTVSVRMYAQQPKLVLPIGHTSMIYSLSFSPDSKRILTTSGDKSAKIWDVQNGALLADLTEHTGFVRIGAYSRDGKLIVTGSFDSTAIIWDAASGRVLQKLKVSSGRISSVDFSPDKKFVITVGEDHKRDNTLIYGNEVINTWDVSTGKMIHRLDQVWGKVISVAFSDDGKYILGVISIRKDFGEIIYRVTTVWDAISGKLLHELKGDWAMFSPGGKQFYTVLPDGSISIYELPGNKIGTKPATDTSTCNYAKFSKDGKWVISSSGDDIIMRDVFSGKILYTLSGEYKKDYEVVFSNDGKWLVSVSDNISVYRELLTGKVVDTIKSKSFFGQNVAISPNGKYIAVSVTDNDAMIWETTKRSPVSFLRGHTAPMKFSVFSPDNKYLLTIMQENSLLDWSGHIWDGATGKLLNKISGHPREIVYAGFTSDGRSVITAGEDESIKIWNVATGKKVQEFEAPFRYVFSADISPDKKHFLITNQHDAMIGQVGDIKIMETLSSPSREIISAKFSPDGKYIVSSATDDRSFIYDAKSLKLLHTVSGHKKEAGMSSSTFSAIHEPVAFSPDGKWLATVSLWGPVKIWELSSGRLINELKKPEYPFFYRAWFSQDSKKLATISWSPELKLWDVQSGVLLYNLTGHSSEARFVSFSPDNKKIISTAEDNTAKAWDTETGKLLYTFFPVDSIDYIIQLPSGYYQSSSNAAKLLHYTTPDMKIISFEQLDVKYNRPDKVLEAVGNKDTILLDAYRKAYYKRIKKLGIDTLAFREGYSLPVADFVNSDTIEYEQKSGKLILHFKGLDSIYKLDRFNVWVNGSPIYGQRGFSLRSRNSNVIDTIITITLSQGENRVEASVSNVNGTESYRLPLLVNYTPVTRQREMTRFIGIGIDRFAENRYNLQYSAKDIRDFSIKLKEKYGDDIIIDTLFNEHVTVNNLRSLKQKLQQTTENDKVIVAYSGHGLLSKDFDYYLSTFTINFDKPEQNGLPYDELENLLDSIPARKKLLLIDACHSGEVDKEDLVTLNASSDSLIKGLKPVAYKKDGQLGLKNSFELMQDLFVNVGKSTGATVISAAAGTQFALERNDLKNGVFTYAILEAMKNNPTMTVTGLRRIVGERVTELTKGLQQPTSRNENNTVDWKIW